MDSGTRMDDLSEPPSFQLPNEFFTNRQRFELWALRVPVKMDISVLNGMSFQLENQNNTWSHRSGPSISNHESTSTSAPIISKVTCHDHTYGLLSTNPLEFDTYRLVLRDEHSTHEMKPLVQPFDQLINLVDWSPTQVSETDIAPSMENAKPMNDDKWSLRIPYKEKEQVRGLKRRWTWSGTTGVHENLNQTLWGRMEQEKIEKKRVKSPKQKKSRKHESQTMSSESSSPWKQDKKIKKEKHG
jgi:hypothetical protein